MSKRVVRILFVMIITLSFLLGVADTGEFTAQAQGSTEVSIEPLVNNITVGALVELKVNVANAADLNAYDLKVDYNKDVLTLESWSHGGFLSNVSVVYEDEKPGWLRLAVTQLESPGATGNGTLLNLRFRGKSLGHTTIEIQDAQLVNTTNQRIYPTARNGVVDVSAQGSTHTATATHTTTSTASATSTHTPTASATMNPLITWTPTRTRTPTAIYGRTITPIYAIVITRTGTPGTAVVVPPAGQVTTATPFSIVTGPEDAITGEAAAGATENMLPNGAVTDGALQQSTEMKRSTEYAYLTAEWENATRLDEFLHRTRNANGVLWGMGFLLLAVITGLTVLFSSLWRKI
jgi:hypothetical protein